MNNQLIEISTYLFAAILIIVVLFIYLYRQTKNSKLVEEKIVHAKATGIHEPVSLYPIVDPNRCIQSGACITACFEEDILGIKDGRAMIINASHCIGHGACFSACPVDAISLWIGTEKRGVDLPHISSSFETNVPGIYIAGELGGMGLIKNAVTQGKEAVENISKVLTEEVEAQYDLIIVGAGPAGISASLMAKKLNMKSLTLEQDTLGGTVFTYPRAKIVMTSPMDLPLHGKVKISETTKLELLQLWKTVLGKNKINIRESTIVKNIVSHDGIFTLETSTGDSFTSKKILLAIGRGGTPRKLNVPGELSEKVYYRLLDSDLIVDKKIVVVGGGGAAVEASLLLATNNQVTLSYRGETFSRLNALLLEKINKAMGNGLLKVMFNTNLVDILPAFVLYKEGDLDQTQKIENDIVYIFAGGELPTQFLKKIGIEVSTTHGNVVMKHEV